VQRRNERDIENVLGRTRRVHFVGIGGIGMSGIAELLVNLGYQVSGSDAQASATTRRLVGLGVRVHQGHDAAYVADADVVVVSSAVRSDNPEVAEARRRQVPVIPRAEMLAELMRLKTGIAIAGAHGKTTTTSMVAFVLEQAGLDPTAVIGGRLSAFGSNARLGNGAYMVAEADESDGSFLHLSPVLAVITNVDHEHLDHYGSFDRLCDAFVAFANRVPFHGAIVVGIDDEALARLVPRMSRRVVTFGIEQEAASVCARDVVSHDGWTRCHVLYRPRSGEPARWIGDLELRVPGAHNVRNALAAVAIGLELDIPFDVIAGALRTFAGAERRLQVLGEAAGVLVVDDYGHHPTEIAAVLHAVRAAWNRRVVVVFQPHRYTRTAALLDDFAHTLAAADVLFLLPIYAASEDPIGGVSSSVLAERVSARGSASVKTLDGLDVAPDAVAAVLRPGDLVLTLGAGSVGSLGPRLLARLRGEAA
jgi:UDP-N-acetylmuramate--alanine ligase